ncbi:MAG: DUF721 domain-containing protein [Desulfovibrio sp.]|nr:DUF721 domain-containing protein [Desulfovibrio sp.]
MKKNLLKGGKSTLFSPNTQFTFSDYLTRLDKEEVQRSLKPLWQCWETVLGDDLNHMAIPLGHRKKSLIVGCRDSMELQDLKMYEQDILERVNAFLATKMFNKVIFTIVIDESQIIHTKEKPLPSPEKPIHKANGSYLDKMDPSSPVARCYAAYCDKNS